jgi:GT2 family glycosyltransferase
MFVDGDCVITDGFLEAGNSKLATNPKLAVVVGRLREQYPDRSVYNRLCDAEWVKPVGPIRACGGNALIRAAALQGVDGYREDLIAGEEPELCVRLANAGWSMECIEAEMGFHDAKMTRFSQWWKRSTRSGHAFAEGFALHGSGPNRHNAKQLKSVLVWGLLVPCVSVISSSLVLSFTGRVAILFSAIALVWPVGWAFLVFRILRFRRSMGDSIKHALLYSVFCVFGKIPNSLGALNYFWLRLMGQRRKIIEY